MLHFVTSADASYLAKAFCLIESFPAQRSAGTFWLFARDSHTVSAMGRLDGSGAVVVSEKEYDTAGLRDARSARSPLEYACTAKSIFLQHVMARAAAGDWVIWL